jgi:heme exporter protein C
MTWTVTLSFACAGLVWLVVAAGLGLRSKRPVLPVPWEHPIGILGLGMLTFGNYAGLYIAPAEKFMGDAGRILYVHVPAAWIAMLCFLVASSCALAFLMGGKRHWDSAMESSTEVGIVQTTLLLILGSIFARPTWGVWWDWDPRLTSSTVMLLSFIGVMLLRSVVRDSDRRATWSAVATVISGVNVPIVYQSVKWWRSLHQVQSEMVGKSTIDPSMRAILYFNVFAFLFVTIWFMARRYRLAEARALADLPDELPPMARASAVSGAGVTQ